ncbi:MAG: hypothetical protein HZT43_21415 [Exiguobacterium profundum]|nr:MAG: hypothetical protein HZT43_21415 [Exiguobacterium profundum]
MRPLSGQHHDTPGTFRNQMPEVQGQLPAPKARSAQAKNCGACGRHGIERHPTPAEPSRKAFMAFRPDRAARGKRAVEKVPSGGMTRMLSKMASGSRSSRGGNPDHPTGRPASLRNRADMRDSAAFKRKRRGPDLIRIALNIALPGTPRPCAPASI